VYSYKINNSRGKHIVQAWDQKSFSREGRRKHLEEMVKNGFSTAGYENLSTVKVLVEFDCKKNGQRLIRQYVRFGQQGFIFHVL